MIFLGRGRKTDSSGGPDSQSVEVASTERSFGGISVRVTKESDTCVVVKFQDGAFWEDQLKALANRLNFSFGGIFEYPITCAYCATGLQLTIDKSRTNQPGLIRCSVGKIADELLNITDDIGGQIFSTKESAQDYLSRQAASSRIANDVFPIFTTNIRLDPIKKATKIVFNSVMKRLAESSLLNLDQELEGHIESKVNDMFATMTADLAEHKVKTDPEALAKKQSDLSDAEFKPQFIQPPPNLGGGFGIPVLILELVLQDLDEEGCFSLSETVVNEINEALSNLYIETGRAQQDSDNENESI